MIGDAGRQLVGEWEEEQQRRVRNEGEVFLSAMRYEEAKFVWAQRVPGAGMHR
jgi:hypothetical protein